MQNKINKQQNYIEPFKQFKTGLNEDPKSPNHINLLFH